MIINWSVRRYSEEHYVKVNYAIESYSVECYLTINYLVYIYFGYFLIIIITGIGEKKIIAEMK